MRELEEYGAKYILTTQYRQKDIDENDKKRGTKKIREITTHKNPRIDMI